MCFFSISFSKRKKINKKSEKIKQKRKPENISFYTTVYDGKLNVVFYYYLYDTIQLLQNVFPCMCVLVRWFRTLLYKPLGEIT